jgi:cytoskeletal protein RodZ
LVGELLKKAREESGKDLKEISAILKIRCDYLRALEEENFQQLPEEVYIKGYIREYAEFLHIDPETALSAYVIQTSPPTVTAGEPPTKGTSDRKKLKTTYVLIPFILVIFGLLLFAVLHSPQEEPDITHKATEPDEVMPPPVIEPSEEIPRVPVETTKEGTSTLPETSQELLTPHADTIKKTPPDSEHGQKPVAKTVPTSHTLQVMTTETVWLLITADDSEPKEMTLRPGETVTFQADEGFSLKLGNAGGAKVVFNGKDMGNLGEKGQVINLTLPEND